MSSLPLPHHVALALTAALQLTREYKTISENPPPYIEAHPSDSNILEYALSCQSHRLLLTGY